MMVIKIIFVAACFMANTCFAATYYISPTGNNAADGSTGSPWKTFAYAFYEMSAGDTLILKDGTYSLVANTGAITFDYSTQGESGQPPSGISKSQPTIVQAEHDGLAIVDGTGEYTGAAVFIGRSDRVDSYVKISGIKTIGGVSFYNADYCYLKNTGVNGSISIGTADHTDSSDYNLIEDCWGWGDGLRIMAIAYEGRYNIFRRVVIRGDGCGLDECLGSGNPNVGISVYNSQNVLLQNVIVIDRILDGGAPYADFATAQHSGGANDYPLTGNQWVGCMSIGAPDSGYVFEGDTAGEATWLVYNSAAINSTGLGFNSQCPNSANLIRGVSLKNFTAYNPGTVGVRVQDYIVDGEISDSIVYNAGTYGVSTDLASSYMDVFGSTTGAYQVVSCSSGCLTDDPELLYTVRVEDSSPVDGTGTGGINTGATIIYKHGSTGAFYGDAGYNTLTDDSLWPWPNETRIKSDMSQDSARGFCSTEKQLNGIETITLTSYIWELLGSEMPAEIYSIARGGGMSSGGVCTGNIR